MEHELGLVSVLFLDLRLRQAGGLKAANNQAKLSLWLGWALFTRPAQYYSVIISSVLLGSRRGPSSVPIGFAWRFSLLSILFIYYKQTSDRRRMMYVKRNREQSLQ